MADGDARKAARDRPGEAKVNNLKMPLAFADQFYVLRDHIRFVRDRDTNRTTE